MNKEFFKQKERLQYLLPSSCRTTIFPEELTNIKQAVSETALSSQLSKISV
jgi:hypothetical protein